MAGVSALGVAGVAATVRVEDERSGTPVSDTIDAGLDVIDVADVAVELGGTVLEVMGSVLAGIFEL